MATPEERIARVEGVLEEVREEIREIRAEMRERRAEMRVLRPQREVRFSWLLGVQITMWVTIILAILFRR